jgi:DNA repair exonuclease SbcCD ATPase subunit
MILDAIGTFDNFTKVSLQTQGGKDDYLSLSQQEKNTLLREYNGLTPCDIRYDLVNKKFNQVKSLQKNLGDPSEIEKKIEESENAINDLKNNLENIKKEKIQADKEIDLHNNEILNLVQKLHKLENVSDNNPETIQAVIESNEENLKRLNIEIEIKEDWLKDNFIREIPAGLENLNEENLNKSISSERNKFQSEKEKYISIQEWLKLNLIKESFSTEESEIQLEKAKEKLLIIKNDLIIAKGKKCPTCGSVTKAADLNKEQECIKKIEQAESFIIEKQKFIQDQKTIEKENQKIIQEQLKLESLKNSLENSKLNIDQFKLKLEQLKNIKFDLVHNQKIKQTNDEINKAKQLRDNCSKIIQEKNIELKNLLDNKDKIKENELLQNRIKSLEESIKGYKLIVFNSDKNITEYVSKITIQEKNIENYTEKLNQIKESINTYNKYSIYLQAVSRDGIPAQILRKKLPIINYKINSILQNIVNFKIELLIKSNGDIIDYYYFNDDKSDALPLSLGSGSQKFIGSVAIRDALHYISCLVKPSFCIIDEGFGTLDDEKSNDIINVFNYLKTKYRNVIIITHKSVIKDGVDWIINVKKNSDGLSQDLLQLNPEAGISQISFS